MKLLIVNGANINAAEKYLATPVIRATQNGIKMKNLIFNEIILTIILIVFVQDTTKL